MSAGCDLGNRLDHHGRHSGRKRGVPCEG
jgi:hypothetical protein